MSYSITLRELVFEWHQQNKKIVLVTGVFDILHHAHTLFLKKAKNEGDILVVGLESDSRVTKIKGVGRPVNSQEDRLSNLMELNIANHVFILPEQFNTPEDRLQLLQLIKPAVLAVSSHTPHLDKKQSMMAQVGGEVKVVMEHDPTISTTLLIQES